MEIGVNGAPGLSALGLAAIRQGPGKDIATAHPPLVKASTAHWMEVTAMNQKFVLHPNVNQTNPG